MVDKTKSEKTLRNSERTRIIVLSLFFFSEFEKSPVRTSIELLATLNEISVRFTASSGKFLDRVKAELFRTILRRQ